MRIGLTLCALLFATVLELPRATAQPGEQSSGNAEREVIRLWSGDPPSAIAPPGEPGNMEGAEVAGRPILRLTNVAEPTLEVFPANPERASGAAVVVCPGGAYRILAYDLEGTEIAEWLQGIGVTAVVLKYRVPTAEGEAPGERPLMDVQRAIRIVRGRAEQWNVDPERIGVLGFSAGGHLTVAAGTEYERSAYPAADEIDRLSARPNFLIPIYPAYLAESDADPPRLRDAIRITKDTPPAFVVVTHDDADRGIGAALLSIEMKRHEVPCELHIFVQGGHGYGLRPSDDSVSQWPALCEQWMRAMGFLEPADN